jgi:hypothetical protein
MNALISKEDLIFVATDCYIAGSSVGIPLLRAGHTDLLSAICTDLDLVDYGLSYLRKIPKGD